VFVTDDEGCVNSIILPVFNVGIYEIAKNTISLYPNPVQNILNINLDTPFPKVDLQVVNTMGALVVSQKYVNSALEHRLQLDVNDLPKGIYLLKINTDNYTQTIPWLKQ